MRKTPQTYQKRQKVVFIVQSCAYLALLLNNNNNITKETSETSQKYSFRKFDFGSYAKERVTLDMPNKMNGTTRVNGVGKIQSKTLSH